MDDPRASHHSPIMGPSQLQFHVEAHAINGFGGVGGKTGKEGAMVRARSDSDRMDSAGGGGWEAENFEPKKKG